MPATIWETEFQAPDFGRLSPSYCSCLGEWTREQSQRAPIWAVGIVSGVNQCPHLLSCYIPIAPLVVTMEDCNIHFLSSLCQLSTYWFSIPNELLILVIKKRIRFLCQLEQGYLIVYRVLEGYQCHPLAMPPRHTVPPKWLHHSMWAAVLIASRFLGTQQEGFHLTFSEIDRCLWWKVSPQGQNYLWVSSIFSSW